MKSFFLEAFLRILELLWYPGLVVRLVIAQFGCRLLGVPVTDCRYFRFGFPIGYVQYRSPNGYLRSSAILLFPMLLSVVFGSLLATCAFFQITRGKYPSPLEWVGLWFGFSLCINALPEDPDVWVPLMPIIKLVLGTLACVSIPALLLLTKGVSLI